MWYRDGWCCDRGVVPGFPEVSARFVIIVAGEVGIVVVIIGGANWLTL